ncbi:MAG TPA: hypothetical protein VEY70_18455 [Metabacillus sp.]|nr:hypothetical protein [Metabacillus sp.]
MNIESHLDRKQRLKGEGKFELPLNIDTKKYLVWKISFWDLLIAAPFIFLSLILMYIANKILDDLSTSTIIVCLSPALFVIILQLTKHPIRKNISLLQYGYVWKWKYRKRTKEFYYQKGEIDMHNIDDQDTRKKLGIKNIYSGCYETTDNRFVKVLEVSSINLALMNRTEQIRIFDSYRTFLSDLQLIKHLQIEQISQPINLSQYMLYVKKLTEKETNAYKRMLGKSYQRYVEDTQKSRNMVSRKRYVVIDQPISSDREKSLEELERKVKVISASLENMIRGHERLNIKVLGNDELLKLMYTCLDYDNAQALGDYIVTRASNKVNISLGERTAREIIETYDKQLKEHIN